MSEAGFHLLVSEIRRLLRNARPVRIKCFGFSSAAVATNLRFSRHLRKPKRRRKRGKGEKKMKTNVIRMFLALSVVCIGGNVLDAQSRSVSGYIPFAFQAADKAFPEGKYVVGPYGESGVQTLHSPVTGSRVFIAGAYPKLDGDPRGRLVFHCYG